MNARKIRKLPLYLAAAPHLSDSHEKEFVRMLEMVDITSPENESIGGAFLWSDTPQGIDYWSTVSARLYAVGSMAGAGFASDKFPGKSYSPPQGAAVMTPALPELVALSEKATGGHWGWSLNGNIVTDRPNPGDDWEIAAVYSEREDDLEPINAEFIARLVNWFRANHEALATQPARDSGLGEDARDAARYRWLRGTECSIDAIFTELPNYGGYALVSGNELDAAIDAALAIPSEGEKS